MTRNTPESRRARWRRGIQALLTVAATVLALGQITACVPGHYYVSSYGYRQPRYYRYGYYDPYYYDPYYYPGPGVVVAPPRPGVVVAPGPVVGPARPGVVVAPGRPGAVVVPRGAGHWGRPR